MRDGLVFKGLTAITLSAAVFLAAQAPARAENFDPTRPPLETKPGPAPVVHVPQVNPHDYKVTSILMSDKRKVAGINHQVVTVGDTVGGQSGQVTVTAIRTAEITLRNARREFVVRLPSSEHIKSVVSDYTGNFKEED